MTDFNDKLKMVWNSIYKLENKTKLFELQDERLIELRERITELEKAIKDIGPRSKELESTINIIKEKMIKSNSDSIEEMTMDNMLKFNVIGNHSTILADMKERIEKLEASEATDSKPPNPYPGPYDKEQESLMEKLENPSEQDVAGSARQTVERCDEYDMGICQVGLVQTCKYHPTCMIPKEEKQAEFELVEKFIPPRGIHCEDCMNMGKNEIKVEKADLEKIKRYNNRIDLPHSYSNKYLINEILEKYLEEDHGS